MRPGDDVNQYFAFTVSDDGDVRIDGPMSTEELDRWLDEHRESFVNRGAGVEFERSFPADTATFASNKVVIFKGEIVVPKPVRVVTKFVFP